MGRMVKTTYSDLQLAKLFEHNGMETRFWRDEITGMLNVLAKPDLHNVPIPQAIVLPSVTVEGPPWENHFWARFLRWLDIRVLRSRRLPRVLRLLAFARIVSLDNRVKELPADIIERIKVMRDYLLLCENIEATKVLLGPRALNEFHEALMDHMTDGLSWAMSPHGYQVLGLNVQVNPFLAEDAVIVC